MKSSFLIKKVFIQTMEFRNWTTLTYQLLNIKLFMSLLRIILLQNLSMTCNLRLSNLICIFSKGFKLLCTHSFSGNGIMNDNVIHNAKL